MSKNLLQSIFTLLAMVSLVFGDCCLANASDESGSDWKFNLAPYVWFTSASGDLSVKGVDAEIDADFSDIYDVTEAAAFLRFDVSKDDWSVFVDALYSKSSMDADIDGPISGLINIDADFEMDMWVFDVALARRIYVLPSDKLKLDIFLGVRSWIVDTELDADVSGLVSVDVADDKDWIDPIVGFRFTGEINEDWHFFSRADIGGMVLSDNSSNVTWNLELAVGYQVNDWMNVYGGYRALHVDYDEGSGSSEFELDATLHGPVLALKLGF